MRRLARLIVLGALAALVVPSVAQAGHTTDPRTKNIHPLGHIIEPAVLGGFGGANPDIHTDCSGASSRSRGTGMASTSETSQRPDTRPRCRGPSATATRATFSSTATLWCARGITPAGTPGAFGAGNTCDGVPVPPGAVPGVGFEGLHVFDISDLDNPERRLVDRHPGWTR
jgi:hypothetical protein